jgi:hypothetical protein
MFSNKVYDYLKWLCIIVLPALSILVKTLCAIWGIPFGDEIATTITALATCLGAILMISNVNYYKNEETVDENIEE